MTNATNTLTDDERKQLLIDIGIKPNGATLTAPAKTKTTKLESARLAPEGVDPHTMPASEIVFDEHLLDGFPDLTGQGYKAAGDYVFSLYKSPARNKERHSLLHRRITEFVGAVRSSRASGGHIRDKIKTTAEERELAQLLASKGLTVADLVALLEGGRE